LLNKEKASKTFLREGRIIRFAYDPHWGSLTTKNPLPCFTGFRSFCFHPSPEQARFALKTKNPHCFRSKGFFFVDKRFEISNREIIKDLIRVVDLEGIISSLSEKL